MAEDEFDGPPSSPQEPGAEGPTEEQAQAPEPAGASSRSKSKSRRKRKGKRKPTDEEIEVALVFMDVHLRTEQMTCREIDQRLGWPLGYTSKVLRGELPCSKTRGLEMRAAMGIDEKKFQAHMREQKARRKAMPKSLIRSPDKPRAKSPRPPRTQRREVDPGDDEEIVTLPPAVLREMKHLARQLTADLIRKGKLKPSQM